MRSGVRPKIYSDYHSAHPTIHNIIISCWQTESEYRMTFHEIYDSIEELLGILEE